MDDEWFEHAADGEVVGEPVKMCPTEESIAAGVPVFNVALPVLRRVDPSGLPIKIIELSLAQPQAEELAATPAKAAKTQLRQAAGEIGVIRQPVK